MTPRRALPGGAPAPAGLRLLARLQKPVDIASLVFFRIAFGVIMLVEVWRYFSHDWIARYYIQPAFHFKYFGFEWVHAWPGDGMYWHFAILAVLAAMILTGTLYRVASVLFLAGFSYVFLIDQARYLNHFYLVILIAFLMCIVPAHRAFSVDAWLRPALRSSTVPTWAVWVFVAQFEIVYLYAGIVKINHDWLHLQPLTMWLAADADLPLIGPLLTETWVVACAAYGAIALHLVGAPLLLWRRTRIYVFILYICFHLMNHVLFRIGIFPWMTIVGTLMFFDPAWPRRFGAWLARRIPWPKFRSVDQAEPVEAGAQNATAASLRARVLLTLLGLWLAFQILMPLRHWLYPGDVAWTEEGHRFAWRMKLRTKTGVTRFRVSDPATGKSWWVHPREYLTRKQVRTMACRPDMILQFAHLLAREAPKKIGVMEVEVRTDASCALNGRRYSLLIDPETDLARQPRSLAPAHYIRPLAGAWDAS